MAEYIVFQINYFKVKKYNPILDLIWFAKHQSKGISLFIHQINRWFRWFQYAIKIDIDHSALFFLIHRYLQMISF